MVCDAALYEKKRGHTTMCRERLEEAMKADEVDEEQIRRRIEEKVSVLIRTRAMYSDEGGKVRWSEKGD